MNADLLAMLSGGMPPLDNGGGRGSAEDKGVTLLQFKAGRMKAELQQNGKYLISPDPRRGEVRLLWKANANAASSGSSAPTNANGGVLTFEWVDRRTTRPVTTLTIFPEDSVTFERVFTGESAERSNDRVYLLQYGNASDRRFFFWMQELTDLYDGKYRADINTYCSDPAECAKKAREIGGTSEESGTSGSGAAGSSGGAVDPASLTAIMQGLTSGSDAPAAAGASSGGSGDALTSIVENLTSGASDAPSATPAAGGTSAATPSAPPRPAAGDGAPSASAAAAPAPGGAITLADLQAAMGGLATSTPPGVSPAAGAAGTAVPGPPLSELATSEAIETSGILSDPAVRSRLIELLPEEQRTDAMLEENLRSPQVQQCLKSLTAALVSGEDFNSILANFQLKPEDGAASMASGNPIQAFLDCVLKQVEREKESGESKEEEASNEGEGKMEE